MQFTSRERRASQPVVFRVFAFLASVIFVSFSSRCPRAGYLSEGPGGLMRLALQVNRARCHGRGARDRVSELGRSGLSIARKTTLTDLFLLDARKKKMARESKKKRNIGGKIGCYLLDVAVLTSVEDGCVGE